MTSFSRAARCLLGAFLLFIAAALPAAAQAPAPAKPPAQTPAQTPAPAANADPVVAVANGEKILLSDVVQAHQGLPQQYRQMPLQMIYGALLDQLIDLKLAAAEGRKGKVQDQPEFKRQLASIEERLVQQAWVQQEVEKRITPEALQQRYLKKVGEMPAEDEVKARHILVATEDEAKAILAEIQKGGDFEKLAREKSTDKASGAQGGDLGWFRKSEMVKEFADAAFALNKGETTTTPVKTQFGYHIIRADDRRPAAPPTQEEMAEDLRAELSREAYQQVMETVRKGAKIERFNMDGSKLEPAAPGATPPAANPAPAPKK